MISILLIMFSRAAEAKEEKVRTGSRPLRRVLEAYDRGVGSDRIVQGVPTTIEKHPWQVALVAAEIPNNSDAQFCGASVIAPRWLITAAHCVDEGTLPSQVAVLAGTASLVSGGSRVRLDKDGIVIHKLWNPKTDDFDIALLRVDSDLEGVIRGMTSQDSLKEGQAITVTGWGALAWAGKTGSKDLLEVNPPYVATSRCNKKVSYGGRVTVNMLCAGLDQGGPDACQGDSGGPATSVIGKERKLVGIVSWGDGCGSPKKYGVYTRVSMFEEWVQKETSGAVTWR